uniref:C2H2-type domain-containing protein n=1 Tax=Otolemur garnettii TaxID=30611 RepID=H0XKU4_OTOGA
LHQPILPSHAKIYNWDEYGKMFIQSSLFIENQGRNNWKNHDISRKTGLFQNLTLNNYLDVYADERNYQCNKLEKTMNQASCSVQYLKAKHSGIIHTCKKCEKVFQQCLKLISHDFIHNEEYSHKCTERVEAFLQSEEDSKIQEVDIGEGSKRNKKCQNVCRESCSLRNNKIRSQGKPYRCKQCGVSFTLSPKFGKHHMFHPGEKPYKCEECGKAFNHSSTLRVHQRIHSGEKPYTCEECGKAFNHSGALRNHQRIHTGNKPYKCEECGKAFNCSSHLRIHHRIHTGEKPYKCEECGKAFNCSWTFRRHYRIHTGEKPYTYENCGKAFNHKYVLRNHQRIHTGNKQYKCEKCCKAFNRSSHFREHHRIHTGEKPYKCEECGKAFCYSSALLKIKVHQGFHQCEN